MHRLMGEHLTSKGRRRTSCQTWVQTQKLNKASAHPTATDECYSLTTYLVVAMMVVLINQELRNSLLVPGEEFTASAQRPPLGEAGQCSFSVRLKGRSSLVSGHPYVLSSVKYLPSLQDKFDDILYFLIVNKPHEKPKPAMTLSAKTLSALIFQKRLKTHQRATPLDWV